MKTHRFGCTGKEIWWTESEARKRIKKMFGHHRAYKCKYEDHWHITSMTKKMARKVFKEKKNVFFKLV